MASFNKGQIVLARQLGHNTFETACGVLPVSSGG